MKLSLTFLAGAQPFTTQKENVMNKLLTLSLMAVVGLATITFATDELSAAEEAKKVELSGTFEKKGDDGIVFTDSDEKKYFVIKGMHEKASPHLGKKVDIAAKVKPTKSGKGNLMVHIIRIKPAKS